MNRLENSESLNKMVQIGNDLERAIRILKNGGIVILPADTVFIPACRIDKPGAIKRLYKIKKRPQNQPTLVLVNSISMAKKYVKITKVAKQLINKFWPAALTVILPAKNNVPKEIQGKGGSLGVRYPNYSFILKIIKLVGVPILAPSANFKGKPTPKKFEDLDKNFIKLVDYVLKGKCKIGMESTIIDVTVDPPKVLRQGILKISF